MLVWSVRFHPNDSPPVSFNGELMWKGSLLAVAYATFSVGLGAIFPKFESKNPFRTLSLPVVFLLYLMLGLTTPLAFAASGNQIPLVAQVGLYAIPVVIGVGTAVYGSRRLSQRDVG